MSDPQASPGYVDEELLRALFRKLEPIKKRSYDMLRIRPGATILDAGCGPGLDTAALATLVGAGGHIIGIDHDPGMVAAANRRAESLGLGDRVVHKVGDVTALAFDDGAFDAVRCDRVLQHVSNSEQAMSEFVRVAKPGGRLAVFEPDWSTFSIDALDRDLEWRLRRVATERFANGYAGRQLWRWMVVSGLEGVEAEPTTLILTHFAEVRSLLLMDRVEQAALESGVISSDELENWRVDASKADTDGTFFASVTGILVSGTKPGGATS